MAGREGGSGEVRVRELGREWREGGGRKEGREGGREWREGVERKCRRMK